VATDQQVNRIVGLAGVALNAYRPDRRLYDALNPALDGQPEGGEFFVQIDGTSQDLRHVTAVLETVQLAFDAAAVAVLYAAEVPDYATREPDIELLQRLAREPTWALEIEQFNTGNYRVSLRGLFGTAKGRNKVLAVAGVAATILIPIVPGAALTALVVINGVQFANAAFGEALDKFLDDHLSRTGPPWPQEPKARVRAMRIENQERAEAKRELAEEVAGLERNVADHVAASVDLQSLAAAGVRSITVEVKISLQPAA
jgi:hypothetical protein